MYIYKQNFQFSAFERKKLNFCLKMETTFANLLEIANNNKLICTFGRESFFNCAKLL